MFIKILPTFLFDLKKAYGHVTSSTFIDKNWIQFLYEISNWNIQQNNQKQPIKSYYKNERSNLESK